MIDPHKQQQEQRYRSWFARLAPGSMQHHYWDYYSSDSNDGMDNGDYFHPILLPSPIMSVHHHEIINALTILLLLVCPFGIRAIVQDRERKKRRVSFFNKANKRWQCRPPPLLSWEELTMFGDDVNDSLLRFFSRRHARAKRQEGQDLQLQLQQDEVQDLGLLEVSNVPAWYSQRVLQKGDGAMRGLLSGVFRRFRLRPHLVVVGEFRLARQLLQHSRTLNKNDRDQHEAPLVLHQNEPKERKQYSDPSSSSSWRTLWQQSTNKWLKRRVQPLLKRRRPTPNGRPNDGEKNHKKKPRSLLSIREEMRLLTAQVVLQQKYNYELQHGEGVRLIQWLGQYSNQNEHQPTVSSGFPCYDSALVPCHPQATGALRSPASSAAEQQLHKFCSKILSLQHQKQGRETKDPPQFELLHEVDTHRMIDHLQSAISNISHSLAWAFSELAHHDKEQDALRTELHWQQQQQEEQQQEQLGKKTGDSDSETMSSSSSYEDDDDDDDEVSSPSIEDDTSVDQLTTPNYLRSTCSALGNVIREVLRLHPPLPAHHALVLEVQEDDYHISSQLHIPSNSVVVLPTHLIQRNIPLKHGATKQGNGDEDDLDKNPLAVTDFNASSRWEYASDRKLESLLVLPYMWSSLSENLIDSDLKQLIQDTCTALEVLLSTVVPTFDFSIYNRPITNQIQTTIRGGYEEPVDKIKLSVGQVSNSSRSLMSIDGDGSIFSYQSISGAGNLYDDEERSVDILERRHDEVGCFSLFSKFSPSSSTYEEDGNKGSKIKRPFFIRGGSSAPMQLG